MRHYRHTVPTTVSNPRKQFVSRQVNKRVGGECGWVRRCAPCPSPSSPSSLSPTPPFLPPSPPCAPCWVSVLRADTRVHCRSVPLSFCFLSSSLPCAPWWFFLSVSHSPFLSLARFLSRSLTGSSTLLFSNPTNPHALSLFLSLSRDCDGPQRPVRMRKISCRSKQPYKLISPVKDQTNHLLGLILKPVTPHQRRECGCWVEVQIHFFLFQLS